MGAGASALAPGVEQWTADQVGDFVGAFGAEYAQYKAAFVEKGINGKTLLTLDDGDLGELGVTSAIHKKRLLAELLDLKAHIESAKAKQQAARDASAGKYGACFCHNREEAVLEARYLKERLVSVTGKDAYMDGDNTAGLDELCARIDESSVLIFVQTEHALSCSWCLIQLAHAIEKKVPIVAINILGKGYDLEQVKEWLTCCDISVELAYRHAHALEHIKSSKSNLDLEMLSYHLSGVCSLESHEFNPTAPDAQVEQQITEISDAIKTTAPTKMPMSLNLWKRKRKGLNPELEANRTSGSVTARAALESYDSFNAELSGNPINRRMADCSSKLLNAAWGQGIAVTSRGGEVGSGTVTGIAIPKLRLSNKFRVGTYRVTHHGGISVRMGAELTSKAVGKLQLHDTFDVFEVKEVEYNGKTLQRLKVKSGWTSLTNAKDGTSMAVFIPGLVRVVALDGLDVRQSENPASKVVGRIECGAVVDATEVKNVPAEGKQCFKTKDGWAWLCDSTGNFFCEWLHRSDNDFIDRHDKVGGLQRTNDKDKHSASVNVAGMRRLVAGMPKDFRKVTPTLEQTDEAAAARAEFERLIAQGNR